MMFKEELEEKGGLSKQAIADQACPSSQSNQSGFFLHRETWHYLDRSPLCDTYKGRGEDTIQFLWPLLLGMIHPRHNLQRHPWTTLAMYAASCAHWRQVCISDCRSA